jgi:hypothetical protein
VGPTWWRRFSDGTATSDDLLLIEPFVDMLNHEARALSDTSYEASKDVISLRSLGSSWQPGEQVFICYGCKDNRALLKSYGFVLADNPVDATLLPGGITNARTIFDASFRADRGGNRGEGVTGGEVGGRGMGGESAETYEEEWRERIQMLSQCGVLGDVEKMLVTAGGPSSRAVAGLRLLLSNASEIDALRAMDVPSRLRAEFSMETEQRVNKAVLVLCNIALSISSGDAAAAVEGSGSSSGSNTRNLARMYREERCRLLLRAIGEVEKCGRISADLGVVVQALQDDWLDRQQHDLMRQMNNLGF